MATPKKRRRRKWIVLLVIVAVLGGLTATAVLRRKEPTVTVETVKVERHNLTETVVANGRIQPVLQVKISAEVSGEIIELPVKEGQQVAKGDLLVRIKPDLYVAARQSAEAGYLSAVSGRTLAEANLRKAQLEFERNEQLYRAELVPDTTFVEYRTSLEVAKAQLESSTHQVAVAKASLSRAEEELAKTSIFSPLNGTVSQLNSELGERVVGTAMMTGTEIMTVADLDQMEARVDIGEIDIPLIQLGQRATLEVDAFRDEEFSGEVWEIANSAKGLGSAGGQSQEGIKFEVRVRILDRSSFRPGMTVTAEIETRSRTNVLAVPIQSVTARPPKKAEGPPDKPGATNAPAGPEGSPTASADTNAAVADTHALADDTNTTAVAGKSGKAGRKDDDKPKHVEVVFVVENDQVKAVPVKRGISDREHTEIVEGLTEGQEVVSGGYRAISKDLEDGKKITRGKVGEGDKKPGAPGS